MGRDTASIFTVKSMRAMLDNHSNLSALGQTIWCNWLPIKVNCFIWRLFLRRIPTRANLRRRSVQIPSDLCPLCESEVETENHLFYSCAKIKDIWSWVVNWCNINNSPHSSLNQLLFNFLNCANSKKKQKLLEALTGSVVWFIWKARNDVVFNSKRFSSSEVIVESQATLFTWINFRSKCNLDWSKWCCNPLSLM